MNKTNNCAVVKHRPTGITVKCHATRSLEQNKKEAIRLIKLQLDEQINGPASLANLAAMREAERKRIRERKSRKKHAKI